MVFSFPSRPSGLRINPRDRGAADQNPEGREVTTRPDSVNTESGLPRPSCRVEPPLGLAGMCRLQPRPLCLV